jgi:hypothetical protein
MCEERERRGEARDRQGRKKEGRQEMQGRRKEGRSGCNKDITR